MALVVGSVFAFLTIWMLSNGFVLRDTHKNHLNKKESEDLSVDLNIKDEDYEMCNYRQLGKLNIHISENKFDEIDKFVSEEYEKAMKSHRVDIDRDEDTEQESINIETDNRNDTIGTLVTPKSDDLKVEKEMTGRTKTNYIIIYRDHHDEKDDSNCTPGKVYTAVKIGKSKLGFRILDSIKGLASDSSGDYSETKKSHSLWGTRTWNFAIVWVFVYFAVALPLWCIKGWCCCCLSCKFFKPHETIQEAKKYLQLNTPGVLLTKRGGIVHYEPTTEREIDCYEEFGHFIRTL